MKEDKANQKEVQTPLEKIRAMLEKDRQRRAKKEYWYELQFRGWIKAGSRKEAKQTLEKCFSTRCGISVPYDLGVFGAPSELGVSLELEDAMAEITHTQVRILWFKPYDPNRP